jgi:hypothetical protein
MSNWKEQLARAERYLERFQRAIGRTLPPPEIQDRFDDIYSFFIHCWHVKDYLKADPAFTKRQVEDYAHVAGSPLKICGDIANGLKHFEPRPGASFGEQLVCINTSDSIGGKPDCSPATARINRIQIVGIVGDGKTLDALEVAAKAIEAWKTFTAGQNGLAGFS